MTPSSSNNSSSVNLPRNRSLSRGTSGTSLLQERLRERKGESIMARRRSVDIGDKTLPSSPMNGKEERRPSSSGTGKGMGVKQIEEVSYTLLRAASMGANFCHKHVSTLTKQNFNLKLELHHRRERQLALEARLEAAEKQIEEQAELQEVNEQLLAELEKRDQAVEEAVGIIVSLEDKVERLMKEREIVRSFDAKHDQSYYGSNHDEPFNLPSKTRSEISNAMARMPSFLSEQSESTEALRSLYLPTETYSDSTLPKQSEDAPPTEVDSPRLSVLSESSFMSIYGDKHLSLDNDGTETERETTQLKSESVEKWIDERPSSIRPAPPKRTSSTSRRSDIHKNQFLSINHVLESPLQRMEKLKSTMEKNSRMASTASSQLAKEKPKPKEALKRVLTDKTSFDHHDTLPPTPDTVGTDTLRHYKNSTDTLDQNRIIEGTFLNSSSTIPAPSSADTAYKSTISVRPRSAGETVTSRREGHGWDTETQGDDISSIASTFATQDSSPRGRAVTPDLFAYSSEDRYAAWGRDMMFNHEPTLPSNTGARYENLRHSSIPMHPRSEDTVRRAQYGSNPQSPIKPLETTPRPAPPDRRSSLTATGKFRKSSFSQSPTTPIGNSPVTLQQENKRNRLTSRLFGRSETSPATNPPQQQMPKSSERRQSGFDSRQANEDLERATPPPIKRNRNGPPSTYRPSSAGVGMSNFAMRRQYAFGGDGAGDEVDEAKSYSPAGSVDIGPDSETRTGGRNWLGFSKAGSLRRG
jgi:hypothetical protein